MVAVTLYVDESHKGEHGIVVVAGYIAELHIWDGWFTDAWRAALSTIPSVSEFHASRLNSKAGGLTIEQRDTVFGAVTDVITSAPHNEMGGWASALVFPKVPPSDPETDATFANTYKMCFEDLLAVLYDWASERGTADHVIDIVPDYRTDLGQFLDKAGTVFDDFYKVRGLTARVHIIHGKRNDSEALLPLQAADLLAFETMREVERRLGGCRWDARPWMRRLAESRTHHMAQCWDKKHKDVPVAPEVLARNRRVTTSTLYKSPRLDTPGFWGLPVPYVGA